MTRPGPPFTLADIRDVYDRHPLEEQAILKRVLRQRGSLEHLTALDLATDDETEITDQNHVGGVRFVRELAERAGVTGASRVLDLGAGLGGSARCLAYLYGCRVRAIDASPKRCAEAARLTRLVGLDGLVHFRCGDFTTMPVPDGEFDVLWGQSTWMHVPGKAQFLQRWSRALASGGRVALEDTYLKRLPATESAAGRVRDLEADWKGRIIPLDEWEGAVTGAGLAVTHVEDLTDEYQAYFRRLLAAARRATALDGSAASVAAEAEARAWSLAEQLTAEGVLGYFRLVALKA